jgi:hypothetical protein
MQHNITRKEKRGEGGAITISATRWSRLVLSYHNECYGTNVSMRDNENDTQKPFEDSCLMTDVSHKNINERVL